MVFIVFPLGYGAFNAVTPKAKRHSIYIIGGVLTSAAHTLATKSLSCLSY
jgi:hypothetical protein